MNSNVYKTYDSNLIFEKTQPALNLNLLIFTSNVLYNCIRYVNLNLVIHI